jgi:hypothetical protein
MHGNVSRRSTNAPFAYPSPKNVSNLTAVNKALDAPVVDENLARHGVISVLQGFRASLTMSGWNENPSRHPDLAEFSLFSRDFRNWPIADQRVQRAMSAIGEGGRSTLLGLCSSHGYPRLAVNVRLFLRFQQPLSECANNWPLSRESRSGVFCDDGANLDELSERRALKRDAAHARVGVDRSKRPPCLGRGTWRVTANQRAGVSTCGAKR